LHSGYALKHDGTVVAWGEEGDDSLALALPDVTGASAVASNIDSGGFCAIVDGGAVRCGSDIELAGPAVALTMGRLHECALLAQGTIECWGSNFSGALGTGDTSDTDALAPNNPPTTVLGISDAIGISAADSTTCATLASGTVQCWGANWLGQLGDGTRMDRPAPVVVSGLSNVASVCTGWGFGCAARADGGVQCWGGNWLGQLGDGTLTDSPNPVVVTGITTAQAITCGESHACALLDDGSIQCWGANDYALGDAELTRDCVGGKGEFEATQPTRCSGTPVQAPDVGAPTAIAGGNNSTCALLSDGSVQCWGENGLGQLGDGTTTDSYSPVRVMAAKTR
jgi:alpha-tubulin suppressor-like RCC1 family protein